MQLFYIPWILGSHMEKRNFIPQTCFPEDTWPTTPSKGAAPSSALVAQTVAETPVSPTCTCSNTKDKTLYADTYDHVWALCLQLLVWQQQQYKLFGIFSATSGSMAILFYFNQSSLEAIASCSQKPRSLNFCCLQYEQQWWWWWWWFCQGTTGPTVIYSRSEL